MPRGRLTSDRRQEFFKRIFNLVLDCRDLPDPKKRRVTIPQTLEELGVTLTERRTVEANEFLQTNFPNIFVCGDVTGPYQFTHTASHQAWYAAVNALFGMFRKFKVDYSVIPFATFTDPEVARVQYGRRVKCAGGSGDGTINPRSP